MFLCHARERVWDLVDRELSLPQRWTEDGPRCRMAGMPKEVPFATQPMLGKENLERAFQVGKPSGWVDGDEVHGVELRLVSAHRRIETGEENQFQDL